jgi:hypothetical protein
MIIHETIAKIMEEVPAISKDRKNTQGQGYNYRGIDDVMNALQPILAKHKLFVVPEVLEQQREERQNSKGNNLIYSIVRVKYTFYAVDGSNVSAVVIGEAFDSGDKATNKAMSAAFKYAMFQTFCIPTEEMIDSETETHEVAAKNATGSGQTGGERKTFNLSEAQIKRLWAIAGRSDAVAKKAAERNLDVNGCVHAVIGAKWKKASVEQLTKAEYDELCNWMEGK